MRICRLSWKVLPKEGKMGKAPKIVEELRQTREQVRENEREWFLDTAGPAQAGPCS